MENVIAIVNIYCSGRYGKNGLMKCEIKPQYFKNGEMKNHILTEMLKLVIQSSKCQGGEIEMKTKNDELTDEEKTEIVENLLECLEMEEMQK